MFTKLDDQVKNKIRIQAEKDTASLTRQEIYDLLCSRMKWSLEVKTAESFAEVSAITDILYNSIK